MHFSVCFNHVNDQVMIRFNNIKFDLIGYIQEKLMRRPLLVDLDGACDRIDNLHALILQFMLVNGYVKTFEAMSREKGIEAGPEVLELVKRKAEIRRALRSSNWTLARYLIWKGRLRSERIGVRVVAMVRVLEMLYYFRKGDLGKAVAVARRYLKGKQKMRVRALEFDLGKVCVQVRTIKGLSSKVISNFKGRHLYKMN